MQHFNKEMRKEEKNWRE